MPRNNERYEIDLLAIAKGVRLSFAELNELRVVDLIDFAEVFFTVEDDAPREATQEDIDAFYRM